MKIGDQVIVKSTGQLVFIKDMRGGQHVLVSWMGTRKILVEGVYVDSEPMEMSATFPWTDLRVALPEDVDMMRAMAEIEAEMPVAKSKEKVKA